MRRLLGIAFAMMAMMAPAMPCAAKEDPAKTAIFKEAEQEVIKICTSIQPFMSRPQLLKGIKLDPDPSINAYADMKGKVTFLMGMVNFAQSRDEIALVCAHEVTHLSGQHIKRSLGTMVLSTVLSETIGGTPGDLVGGALASKQSRKHEREADAQGLVYMWRAGFDPRNSWGFWQDFMNAGGGSNKLMKYLGSHPMDSERVENMKVLQYRNCQLDMRLPHCDEIAADPTLKAAYDKFEGRDRKGNGK